MPRTIPIQNIQRIFQTIYQLKMEMSTRNIFNVQLENADFFFYNRLKHRLSEQSVRFMIRHYAQLANISEYITPHMFRHTFATLLLEEDVDIRYIQNIVGHSSIMTTQIYTHVTSRKQRDILTAKSPRNKINL